MRVKDTRYRIVTIHVSYNLKKEPSLILSTETYGSKNKAEEALQKQMDDLLTVLNQDNNNAGKSPEWSIIPCPNNTDVYMLRQKKTIRSYYIKGYFSIHEVHPGIKLTPNVIQIWDYRGYKIVGDEKNHKFAINFIDMTIGIKTSMDAALDFIDKHLEEERVRNDGRFYYAG